ncbi:MAG: SHOCT domain-containing protein [Metamycoplasmataceae bacterium]
MNENDVKNLVFFKLLNKKEMKFIITILALGISIPIILLIIGLILNISSTTAIIITIVSVVLAIAMSVIGIFWIIIKVKQFMVYNKFSEEFKAQNPNLIIFLILSIFFEIIFVFVIMYSLPKDQAEQNYSGESIKTLNNEFKNTQYSSPTNNTTKTNTSNNNTKMFEELKMLKELLDSGVITEEEFQTKKLSILNN